MYRILLVFTLFSVSRLMGAQAQVAPGLLPPDDRYKADLLLIVAHPDDDVVVGGYLAKAALDDHKRIAVIYCTPGDGGGNAVGYEAGSALGQMRIIEARRAMAAYGIQNVWFLGAHDTPGQDVLWSLDNWNHGRMLGEVVRLVRLTRPNVILTWMPNYVVGENHDDHQASGVIATEAFDMAGDPTQFPEQVAAPRNRVGMMNMTEGLRLWQPQKLYYATDAFEDFGPYWHDKGDLSPFRENFLDGQGPTYENIAVSPSRHVSYARLTAEHQVYYLTQEGDIGKKALESGELRDFEYPTRMIFGKSLVGGNVTGDVFDGVTAKPVPFAPVPGFHGENRNDVSFEIGGPWAFYRAFWKAHGLDNIARLIPVPEVAVRFGEALHIPLTIRNDSGKTEEVHVSAVLPDGWGDGTQYSVYPVPAGDSYPVLAEPVAPKSGERRWQEITWNAEAGGKRIGSVKVRVLVSRSGGLPQ